MVMVHHDSRDYKEAASEAAKHARGIMEQRIAEGRGSAVRLFNHLEREIPNDMLVPGKRFEFGLHSEKTVANLPALRVGVEDEQLTIHRHALGQLTAKIHMRGVGHYVSALAASDRLSDREQAAAILNYHYRDEELGSTRHYCREVNGELRGVLSDQYQPIDARPTLAAVAAACKKVGAIAIEGTYSAVQVGLKAYLPIIFEPVENEVMMVGIQWSTSDYGCGANVVCLTVLRLWCTNKAVMEQSLRQVHIGGRIEGEGVAYSPETLRKNSEAQAAKLHDTVLSLLGAKKVNTLMNTIRAADEKRLEWRDVKTRLERALLKKELDAVRAAFESDDIVRLPKGRSPWRVSNAISLLAGQTEDTDRRMDLERLAGAYVIGGDLPQVEAV
ncbi:MAG: hypothetical protein HUU21_09515 [Polyangiaceae bacterium]|nr:hypothetical protein [Polyangiaceae bacterium]